MFGEGESYNKVELFKGVEMKFIRLLIIAVLVAVPAVAITFINNGPQKGASAEFVVPGGVVPDVMTAIGIARAVLIPIHGKDIIRSEDYFAAELQGDKWTVTCFLPDETIGGKAIVDISKTNGLISRIVHEKAPETKPAE